MTYARPIKVTPSGLEEQVYQAGQARRRIVDTAGIPFPDITYRARDNALLGDLARRAYAAWRADLLPADRLRDVAYAIDAAIAEQFPADDVAVFERYGAAESVSVVPVDIDLGNRDYIRPQSVKLPAARVVPVLPGRTGRMVARVAGGAPAAEDSRTPVPAETLSYFADIVTARDVEQPDFMIATHWVGTFKAREGRFPKWREIEKAFPRLGAWMQAHRAAPRPRSLPTERAS